MFVLTIELYCPYSTEHNNYRNEYYSAIERVIINAYVPYGSFYTLISNFPELRSLTIDFLIDSRCWNIQSYNIGSMKNFKNVYLKLDGIGFNRFEEIAQNCFQFIEVLFLTIEDYISYLFAQRWEQLISSNIICTIYVFLICILIIFHHKIDHNIIVLFLNVRHHFGLKNLFILVVLKKDKLPN